MIRSSPSSVFAFTTYSNLMSLTSVMGAELSHMWVERFVPQVSAYVDSLTPQLSDAWHDDEVFLDMKGGEVRKTGQNKTEKKVAYLWNVMDRKTRFLLTSKLSVHRGTNGAAAAFIEARKVAHGSQPERIFADALKAYPEAVSFWPSDRKPELIAKAGIRKPHANNNRIERLNGTVRERTKVQRGWKSMKTPLAEGQRIHYNFVKPHQALAGQTPADVAGIGIEAKNKWLAMLTEAVNSTNTTSHS